jgi:hypothetical protein
LIASVPPVEAPRAIILLLKLRGLFTDAVFKIPSTLGLMEIANFVAPEFRLFTTLFSAFFTLARAAVFTLTIISSA